jgi:hypothetical protein
MDKMQDTFRHISPEDMTKLRLMAEMLFNLAPVSHDRMPYATKIGESLESDTAKRMAEVLLFIGNPPFPKITSESTKATEGAVLSTPRYPVTDEMVERALLAQNADIQKVAFTGPERLRMRAALEAALNG